MTTFGPSNVKELRGVEARSLDKLRALAIAGQQYLAAAIDQAARTAGADVEEAVTLAFVSNVAFERALDQATPAPGMVSPRPQGPVDTRSLALLREIVLLTDSTVPQALASVLGGQAGIRTGSGRRIRDLSAGELNSALEQGLTAAHQMMRD